MVGGSGPDTLIGADSAQNRFEGGNGDDTLTADASGNDKLFGQGGNDRLESAARGDRLDGGDGGDTLVPGTGVVQRGADSVTGGPGFDSVHYTERTTAVEVTLDDEDNDGGTGSPRPGS